MNSLEDFIKANIKIRENEVTNELKKQYHIDMRCLNLMKFIDNFENSNRSDISDIINNLDYDILYRISSKSFSNPGTIISNRILGLKSILECINFTTGRLYENILHVLPYRYFLVSFYLIAGQIFSDGNHRVCQQYLMICHSFSYDKSIGIIKMIDSCRKHKLIDWSNIHDFLQKFIDNLARIITEKNESIILEKIENLFI